jgi:hypothetical protein
MKDKPVTLDDLLEKLEWVKRCKCERPLCVEEIVAGTHDQSKTGCPSCDWCHAQYQLFRNFEILALLTNAINAINALKLDEALGILKTPVGHIPDEECCDLCDLRAELRQAFQKKWGK